MKKEKTAHNRIVYASPPTAASYTTGTLCEIGAEIGCKNLIDIFVKYFGGLWQMRQCTKEILKKFIPNWILQFRIMRQLSKKYSEGFKRRDLLKGTSKN
jgi:hypothetical protein